MKLVKPIDGTISPDAPFGIPDDPFVDQFEWEQAQRIDQLQAQLRDAKEACRLARIALDGPIGPSEARRVAYVALARVLKP